MECVDKFVVDPINVILILSMIDKIRVELLALMLENFENRLQVISKYVFWMLEVTFPDPCAIVEDVAVDSGRVLHVPPRTQMFSLQVPMYCAIQLSLLELDTVVHILRIW